VVFIEEAQSMPLETLEEVRLLSNLETHRHKLMQIVLFGQPELDRKLEQRDIRQLRERITHSFNLAPLTTGEIREYLHFRLRVAGCPWPQLFSPKAEIMLAKASGGLSRRINILADKALLAAYADPATRPDARNSAGEILPVVYPRHIRTAIADSSYSRLQPLQLLRWASYLAAALGGAFVVGLTLWVFSPAQPTFPDVSSPVVLSQEAGAVQRQPEVAPAQVQIPVVVEAEATQPLPQLNLPAAAPLVASQVAPVPVVEAVATTAPVEIAAAVATAVGAIVQDVQMPDQVVQDEVAEPEMAQQGLARLDVARQEIAQQQEVAQPEVPQPEVVQPEVVQPEVVQPEVAKVAEEQDPVAPALAAAPASGSPGPAPGSESAAVPDGLSGLIRSRFIASSPWLATLSQKTGYSVQLYSEATDNVTKLEEFLDFLELYDMLDASYLCLISGNSRRREQWLVLHGEFAGLSEAREFIDDLPPYIGQHGPYARNMEGIACANDRR
jgi:hypothetical protein